MNDNERLSRELRNRASQMDGHPISFQDVRRSANKMKWQQRAVTGGVAAVALAVAIPVGISVAGNGGGGGNNPPVASPSTTPSSTPTPTPAQPPADGKVPLTFDAPAGEPAKASWLDGRTLHLTDGRTVELPKDYSSVVSYRGGFLGSDFSTGTIDQIREGEVVDSFPGSGFAVSDDGTLIAWTEQPQGKAGTIKIGLASGMGEGETSIEVPAGLHATPIAFDGDRLVYRTDDQRSGDGKVWYVDAGRSHEIPGALSTYGGIHDGKVGVMTSVSDDGSCWAMYGFPGGEYAGGLTNETCDYAIGRFSAGGKYVIGWDAYGDGWGPGNVTILDAETLEPVVDFTAFEDGYGLQDAIWDGDSDSLIASVYHGGVWQLLRLGADGSIETASAPVEGDDMSNPFRFVDVR